MGLGYGTESSVLFRQSSPEGLGSDNGALTAGRYWALLLFEAGTPGSIRLSRRHRARTCPGSLETRLTGYSSRSTSEI